MSQGGFDFVPDVGNKLAVILNSEAAAKRLGYSRVEDVRITNLNVYHDGVKVLEEDVGENKYRSAIWVEAMLAYRGQSRGTADTLLIDDAALLILRAYMGEQVWHDAGPEKHSFVHALKSGQLLGKEIRVLVTWKKSAA